jgi:hypothetical protein
MYSTIKVRERNGTSSKFKLVNPTAKIQDLCEKLAHNAFFLTLVAVNALLAQWSEQWSYEPEILGSNPR